MMKRRVTVHLSEELAEGLKAAAQRPGASKAAIVEAALVRFLDAGTEADDATMLRRLDWVSSKLEQLDRDLRMVNETVALHARYHLTVTPAMPQSQQHAACALGLERFEAFAAQVGRRACLGTPLMQETVDRVRTTAPSLFEHDVQEGVPLGTPAADPAQGIAGSVIINVESDVSAAVLEDGGDGDFPEGGRNPAP
jgi:hypothetical protein